MKNDQELEQNRKKENTILGYNFTNLNIGNILNNAFLQPLTG